MAKDIKLYSIPTCPWCRQTKDYLARKGVEYADFDVATDKSKFEEMVKLSGQMGVPVIVVDGKPQVGFNEKKMDEALTE